MKAQLATADQQSWSDSSEAETERPMQPVLRLPPEYDDLDTAGRSEGQLRRAPTKAAANTSVSRRQARFELLQQWEGTIEVVGADNITASVRDMTDRTMPDEVIDIHRTEFADADADLIAPGAVFYWSIGYRVTPGGTKERLSIIRMRRLPQPTKRQLERIAKEATELSQMFGEHAADPSSLTTVSNGGRR